MINFVYIYFPKDLNSKAWQKAKSFKDKLKSKTKTGLGEALVACEKAWEKVNWDAMIADNAMKGVDETGKYRAEKEFDFAKAVALAEQKSTVEMLRKAVMKAATKARETSQNADLSKDAVKKAQQISKGLLDLDAQLRGITLDDFDTKKARYRVLFDMQIKKLTTDVGNLEKALKDALKTPTLAFWESDVKQKFRSVGNTLGNFGEFKEEWKVWQPWDGFQAENHKDLKGKKKVTPEVEARAITELVNQTMPELKKLQKKAANL